MEVGTERSGPDVGPMSLRVTGVILKKRVKERRVSILRSRDKGTKCPRLIPYPPPRVQETTKQGVLLKQGGSDLKSKGSRFQLLTTGNPV